MIPDNLPATDIYTPSSFSTGAFNDITDTRDSELGGVGIQDTSEGRLFQFWNAEIVNDSQDIIIYAPNTPAFVKYSGQEITEVSLSFDQLMRPTLSFVEQGVPKLLWFDSLAGQEVVDDYPTDYKNPRVSLDDPIGESADSDILFFYMRGQDIFYRQQRDRYTIEYTYAQNVGLRRLHKIGMTSGRRFQVRGII